MSFSEKISKERPILFSGAMVRALLDGSKTQTRRAIKNMEEDEELGYLFPKPKRLIQSKNDTGCCFTKNPANSSLLLETCPYGQPGDRLWVRESHAFLGERLLKSEGQPGYLYRADSNEFDGAGIKWKPSIHMPRAASRLLLEITAVRCERLQDIIEADAVAEGIRVSDPNGPFGTPAYQCYTDKQGHVSFGCPIASYRSLWAKINGLESWEANPWVWVVEFKVIDGGKEAGQC